MKPTSSVSFSEDPADPYNLSSWQFGAQIKNAAFYHRNLTEETLVSTGTPTVDLGHEMVPVGSKMPEVLEGPVITGVYTLPEEPENEEDAEENTQMWMCREYEDSIS